MELADLIRSTNTGRIDWNTGGNTGRKRRADTGAIRGAIRFRRAIWILAFSSRNSLTGEWRQRLRSSLWMSSDAKRIVRRNLMCYSWDPHGFQAGHSTVVSFRPHDVTKAVQSHFVLILYVFQLMVMSRSEQIQNLSSQSLSITIDYHRLPS